MADWQVLRERHRIIHTSPLHRTFEMEITILNTTKMDQDTIYFFIDRRLPGLRIYDRSNREIAFYPRWKLVEEADLDYDDLIKEFTKQDPSFSKEGTELLLLRFPSPVPRGSAYLFRLCYAEDELPEKSASLIPKYVFTQEAKKRDQHWDTIFEIVAPADTYIKKHSLEVRDESSIEESRDLQTPTIKQVKLRRRVNDHMRLRYSISLFPDEVAFITGTYILVLAISLAMFTFLAVVASRGGGFDETIVRMYQIMGSIGVSGSLILARVFPSVWMKRTYFLAPLVLFLVSVVGVSFL